MNNGKTKIMEKENIQNHVFDYFENDFVCTFILLLFPFSILNSMDLFIFRSNSIFFKFNFLIFYNTKNLHFQLVEIRFWCFWRCSPHFNGFLLFSVLFLFCFLCSSERYHLFIAFIPFIAFNSIMVPQAKKRRRGSQNAKNK